MVVCNTSVMQLPAGCPITPITPYLTGLCQLNVVPAMACTQRYIPTSVIAASAPIPPVLTNTTVRSSPPVHLPITSITPPDSPQRTSPPSSLYNGVPPSSLYNGIPHSSLYNGVNIVNRLTPIVPSYTASVPIRPKVEVSSTPVSHATSTPAPVESTKIYSGLVQCSKLLHCAPGVCSIAPTILPSLEVIPSTSIVSSPPTNIYLTSSSQSLSSSLAAWKQSYGMEQVWQCEFKSLFAQYSPHNWMLAPVIDKPEGAWNANVDSAKVRFCCEDCGHGWTSMKGRVAFWFVLNISTGEGVVCLKLYGQQCDRCKSGNYESAMWYPEEVLKVLVNIYNRVGQVYYGFQQAPYHRARRAGKPRTPHNSELCQACKDGVCSERR